MRAKVLQRVKQRRYLDWRQKPAEVDLESISIETANKNGLAHHDALLVADASCQLAAGTVNSDAYKIAVHSAGASEPAEV